eukprot:2338474-Prymnesium_polylepis.1
MRGAARAGRLLSAYALPRGARGRQKCPSQTVRHHTSAVSERQRRCIASGERVQCAGDEERCVCAGAIAPASGRARPRRAGRRPSSCRGPGRRAPAARERRGGARHEVHPHTSGPRRARPSAAAGVRSADEWGGDRAPGAHG